MVYDRCQICGKEFTIKDLWEECQEGIHKRCEYKLKKLAKIFRGLK
jgi:hypothetical protein